MAKLFKKCLLLVKEESTYGVDPSPSVSADAYLTSIPQIEPIVNKRERNIVSNSFGKLAPNHIGEHIKINFKLELKGAASANTAPSITTLWKACGLSIDTDPGVNVIITPTSQFNGSSVALYFYLDGLLHKILGCQGNFKISAKPHDIVEVDFEFWGLYNASHAADTAFPAANTITYKQFSAAALTFDSAGFSVGAFDTGILKSLDYDHGNKLALRDDANSATGVKSIMITDRMPSCSLQMEVEALSSLPIWSDLNSGTGRKLQWRFGGTSDGNNYLFEFYNGDIQEAKYSESNGIAVYDLSYTAHPTITGGNDDIKITADLISEG